MAVELYPHQIDAISRLHNGSILVGDVGSGKSVTALEYYRMIAPGTPINVVTTAKKRDTGEWYRDAELVGLECPVRVFSWNAIATLEDVKNENFIFDEQRLVGYGAWTKAFIKIARNNRWMLLSATPADTWIDLLPVFMANGMYRNKTHFCDEHVVWNPRTPFPKIDRYVNQDQLVENRRKIYVTMHYPKPAKREEHITEVEYNKKIEQRLWEDRWNVYEDCPIKDAGELIRLMRRNTNTDENRYNMTLEICLNSPRVIVFYTNNYELDILRNLHADSGVQVAEWNGQKHEQIPDTDCWIYLVQYQAGSEGWNCTDTDTIVFYSLPYSYKAFEQAKGRIDRMNTPYDTLHYYILKSKSRIDTAVWRSLMRKKNFQIGAFKKVHWGDDEKNTP